MYSYYHGTLRPKANKIRDHNFVISHKIGSLGYGAYAFVGHSGAKNDACKYAWKKFYKKKKDYRRINKKFNTKEFAPCIVKFKLCSINRLLYWTIHTANEYRKFMDYPTTMIYISMVRTKLRNKFKKKHYKKFQKLIKLQKAIRSLGYNITIFNNIGYKNQLDGVIIDAFFKRINSYISNNSKLLGIRKLGINKIGKLPPYYGVLPETDLQNSTELCIKNNKLVDQNSIKVYNLLKGRND